MTRNEAYRLALGYATGRDAAEERHGANCCCQHCPWKGDHGWPVVRTSGGGAAFAKAFAWAHGEFNAGSCKVPPTVDRAYEYWQASLGQKVM